MKNRDKWRPSKYIYRRGRLMGTRDTRELGLGSRLIADLTAAAYGQRLRQHAKGRLLDLGCGFAPLYVAYKDLVEEAVCVDWANTLHKNEYLDYECDLSQPLPFQAAEFDTILLSDVLEHIPEPDGLWREMARILRPSGRLLMNVPFFYQVHEHPFDFYRYTEFALRRFAERHGLRVLEIASLGGVPEIIADLTAKNLPRVPLIGNPLAMFVQWCTWTFVQRTWFGGKVSKATRDNFPLAYFLAAEKIA